MTDKETMAIIKQMVADGQISQEVAEKYFPELKPEDERIINGLILLLRDGYDNVVEGVGIPEAIAWLEKQGEHANFRNKIQIGDKVTRNEDGVLVNLSQLNRVAKKDEKQGEQKPADKVEPKFKVGDCIIDIQGVAPNKIIGYEDDSYLIKTSCSQFYLPMKLTEKNYRLWTIQDAKAGDVLADENSIVIFRKIGNERWSDAIDYYAALYKTNDFLIQRGIAYWGTTEKTDLRPVTKEQRDLLFQKMKEAGYEWDAEKKELRKIEQKPADKDERKGMNIVEEDMTPFQKKVFCIIDTTIEEEQGLKQVCDELLRLAHDEIMQKPAEWSEEDESIYNAILDTVNKDLGLIGVHRDWFKNIKYRLKSLRPRSQWKPTEEQIEAVRLAAEIGTANNSWAMGILKSMYQDLKKLRG